MRRRGAGARGGRRARAGVHPRSAPCADAAARQRPELERLAERLAAAAGECAAAHLDDDVVGRTRIFGHHVGGDLVAEGFAALDREAVQVPLTRERHRARGEVLEQSEVGRVSGTLGPARTDLYLGAEIAQPPEDVGIGIGRHEHPQPPFAGGGDHRGGERRVSAASRWRVGGDPRARSGRGVRRPRDGAARRTGVALCGSRKRCPSRPSPTPRRRLRNRAHPTAVGCAETASL